MAADKVRTKSLIIVKELCTGCRMCELMCSVEKTGAVNPRTSRIRIVRPREGFPITPMVCRHCLRPPCVPVCPVPGAMSLDDGVVLIDQAKCIGCRACVEACPFGAIWVGSEGDVLKCDLCRGDPVCVKFCPPRPENSLPQLPWPRQSCLQFGEHRLKVQS